MSILNDNSYSITTPTTGFSITLSNNVVTNIINPSGTLATGTITMCPNPQDGQECVIATSQGITLFTLNANTGQTIKAGPTVMVANTAIAYIYSSGTSTWYRTQ